MDATDSRKFLVLLIEDNAVDATLVRGLLEQSPESRYRVEERSTLDAGMARIASGGVDVVLLDLTLPDTVGLETFFKAYAKAPYVPFVIITSLDDKQTATCAVRSGAQDYLIKGKIDAETLHHAVGFALERHGRLERLNPHLSVLSSAADEKDAPGRARGDRLFPPLRERDSETFDSMTDRYAALIRRAQKQRESRVVEPISDELHGLAMYLCMLSAGSSDVEEIHRHALRRLSRDADPIEVPAWVEEGQLLLLELFRYLSDHYRDSLLHKPTAPAE